MSNRPAARSQFKNLRASSLYCPKCKNAMPVRERLLLVVLDREIYNYSCEACGESLGRREVTDAERIKAAVSAEMRQPASPSSLLLP